MKNNPRFPISGVFALGAAALLPCLVYGYMFGRVVIVFDIFLLFAVGWMQPGRAGWLLHVLFTLISLASLLIGFNILPAYWTEYLDGLAKGEFEGGSLTMLAAVALFYALLPAVGRVSATRGQRLMAAAIFFLLLAVRLAVHGTNYSAALRTTAGTFALATVQTAVGRESSESREPASKDDFWFRIHHQGFHAADKILLFIMESWGERPEDLTAIARALSDRSGEVKIKSGFVRYRGSTIHGELRSLCGLLTKPSAMTEADYQSCVPRILANHGFQSHAIHGYLPTYYGRDLIWKRMGFETNYFSPTFPDSSFCPGAYRGVCDKVLIDKAFSLSDRPGRRFVYGLTLEGHEPVARSVDRGAHLRKIPANLLYQSKAQLVARRDIEVIHDLYVARAGEKSLVFIVGDHVPPSLKDVSPFDQGLVPYLMLYR